MSKVTALFFGVLVKKSRYYNKKLIAVHEIVENKKIIYNEHHHLDMLKQTFKKHEDIEDYAKKHLKELEKFNEQLSELM